MNSDLVVYSYRRCPFAMRVRLTLHEKNLPFKTVEEDLSNFSDELKALHPEAKVPVLVHGKVVLYESAIITEYLEDAFPDTKRLMPTKPNERAEVRLWTDWCNRFFKPDVDRLKYGTSRFLEKDILGVEERLTQHLRKLENRLKLHPWLVGEEFSLAEVHLYPFVRQFFHIKPTPSLINQVPSLQKWEEKISTRPTFLKTIEKT